MIVTLIWKCICLHRQIYLGIKKIKQKRGCKNGKPLTAKHNSLKKHKLLYYSEMSYSLIKCHHN
jgi:hypothetical protein